MFFTDCRCYFQNTVKSSMTYTEYSCTELHSRASRENLRMKDNQLHSLCRFLYVIVVDAKILQTLTVTITKNVFVTVQVNDIYVEVRNVLLYCLIS